MPGAKARSAHQSRGLVSLVRVTWCFDCSPHGSAGSTGHAEAVVGFTCPKPAGRRCWVATAGDCTYNFTYSNIFKMEWPKSEEKLKFGVGGFWCLNPSDSAIVDCPPSGTSLAEALVGTGAGMGMSQG